MVQSSGKEDIADADGALGDLVAESQEKALPGGLPVLGDLFCGSHKGKRSRSW